MLLGPHCSVPAGTTWQGEVSGTWQLCLQGLAVCSSPCMPLRSDACTCHKELQPSSCTTTAICRVASSQLLMPVLVENHSLPAEQVCTRG